LLFQIRLRRLLAIERIRLSIAADLHDQVGSGLSSLAMMSELLKSDVTDDTGRIEKLTVISTSARNMAQELREIVWYTNPMYDRLDHLIERMRDLPYQLVPHCTIDLMVDDKVPAIPVPPNYRRDIMLSYRELLHNVTKHSAATRVMIQLSVSQQAISMQISDNGEGFDSDMPSKGMGLRNIQDRVNRLKGEVKWTSSPELGTMVTIRVPLP